ncbi:MULTISPECIES: type II toxin-antitoxin system RelB/DinJ family antitoxin [Serratia]|uniref:Type II toxin-antitoxin system RelB/DinJ family antitoxin n=2 Tax=Serratia fonticola TaxID=47917 RepID=A0AAP2BAQ7_SERFO|nr:MULTISPECIES: type II toxin-antitoxin system RelB/DinJ family antitoxin [Serratia]ERK07063.1 DNA-damage-inducible protein J [Serratia fonticola AU-AP2C]ERK14000.1 DNA-damage-inducible protein J [Serratia fonticola AU-P3(3)]ALX93164.1 damage-inducible protein J [Serratia fonticola]MBC3212595.1 type II toxin-antitoxin system RelB/DinJ family antitoxin [Serratia fonticola]MBC3251581.1 type II toxin-antitoxin system RelB/DinJ family antitoxin [Serratia fonticola]
MESRIQFRIENETKLLAQKAAEAKGTTLSEACRRLAQQMADDQRAAEEHENWLKDKVDAAFARLHEGEAVYLTQRQAEERMSDFKAKVRAKYATK